MAAALPWEGAAGVPSNVFDLVLCLLRTYTCLPWEAWGESSYKVFDLRK